MQSSGGGFHGKMVNNSNFADIIIIFPLEKVELFAHSVIINVRCPNLINFKDYKNKIMKKM